jgi:phenylalanyl-tRNA synthetase beta chain
MIDGKQIGYIGEIHPQILSNWNIGMPVAIFEINLNEVYKRV